VYLLPPSFLLPNSVIVDAGANIGIAALYFSRCYPHAKIYCIEPVPANFTLLVSNISNTVTAGKITAFQSALYITDGQLLINDSGWAYNASIGKTGEIPVKSVTIQRFLQSNQLKKIDLFKIDIEGAEAAIFNENLDWTIHVNAILIEIHAPDWVVPIKNKLMEQGFYWYDWNHAGAPGYLFLASRVPIKSQR
jgi:FkbM family methyltransferase